MKEILRKLREAQARVNPILRRNEVSIVFYTEKENIYTVVSPITAGEEEVGLLLSELLINEDIKIKAILCMMPNSEIDLPSYVVRKVLLSLCPENNDAEIFLQGFSRVVRKKLSLTMPKK